MYSNSTANSTANMSVEESMEKSRRSTATILQKRLIVESISFLDGILNQEERDRFFKAVYGMCEFESAREMEKLITWYNNQITSYSKFINACGHREVSREILHYVLVSKTEEIQSSVDARKLIKSVEREKTDAIRAHNRARNRAEAKLAEEKARAELLAEEKARAEMLAKASKLPMPSRRAPGHPSLPPKKKAPLRPR